jgi:recombination protein RecR
MDILPKSLVRVIESFEKLPGIGPKTAQRLSFYLLHVPQSELDSFADHVKNLKTRTMLCTICKNTTENDPCIICGSNKRDRHIICVVEQPTDVLSIERTGTYTGLYHILHGAVDPLNNIGPDEIYISHLLERIKNDGDIIEEVILATNPNMEGEATAMYIQKEIEKLTNGHRIRVTRLAHGLPVGGDLEYTDEVTISRALEGRRAY